MEKSFLTRVLAAYNLVSQFLFLKLDRTCSFAVVLSPSVSGIAVRYMINFLRESHADRMLHLPALFIYFVLFPSLVTIFIFFVIICKKYILSIFPDGKNRQSDRQVAANCLI